MNKKRFVYLLLSILLGLVFIFSYGFNVSFSAYASCRSVAMKTKGYGVWKYESTIQYGSQTYVSFSDGYNGLSCIATELGPLWVARIDSETNVACSLSLSNQPDPCPKDYFGVEP